MILRTGNQHFGLSFKDKGQTYKQIHGCAMGSPVSPVVANICMEKIEEMAIKTTFAPPKTWKQFVDDSFSIITKNAVETFHNTLNSLDPSIQFTLEHENNGKLAFLDTVITRKNRKLNTDVYRKPTHTDKRKSLGVTLLHIDSFITFYYILHVYYII